MKRTPKLPPEQQTYENWYDEQIRLGLEDIKAGRVVSHEDFLKNLAAHMKRLEKKHDRKAAEVSLRAQADVKRITDFYAEAASYGTPCRPRPVAISPP